jgi:hypothetical protein
MGPCDGFLACTSVVDFLSLRRPPWSPDISPYGPMCHRLRLQYYFGGLCAGPHAALRLTAKGDVGHYVRLVRLGGCEPCPHTCGLLGWAAMFLHWLLHRLFD